MIQCSGQRQRCVFVCDGALCLPRLKALSADHRPVGRMEQFVASERAPHNLSAGVKQ